MLFDRSRADCNLHLTNSVGHNTREAKNAADDPESAFSKEFNSVIFFLFVKLHIAFWQIP